MARSPTRDLLRTPASRLRHGARQIQSRLLNEPFGRGRRTLSLIHVAHHKAGTVWIEAVLTKVARRYGMSFATADRPPTPSADIVLFQHSRFASPPEPPWVGSHMVRDPRDMVVSAYHYHRWSDEPWLHEPWERVSLRDGEIELRDITYQQCLNTLDLDDGLELTIEVFAKMTGKEMAAWDYEQPEVLELRYEDVLADEPGAFERLFRHYGFMESCIRESVEIADSCSIRHKRKGDSSHVRSGLAGQWRSVFKERHIERFKTLTGDLVVQLGYESDANW